MMQLRFDGIEIAFTLNEFNQSLERKKNLICRRLFTASKNTSHLKILCLSRAATARKSDLKVCAIMHVQSVQSNVLLVKNHLKTIARH